MVSEQISPYLPLRGKRNLQRTLGLGFCSCTTFSQPYKLEPYYIDACLFFTFSTFCQSPVLLVLWYLSYPSFLSHDGRTPLAQDHSSTFPSNLFALGAKAQIALALPLPTPQCLAVLHCLVKSPS